MRASLNLSLAATLLALAACKKDGPEASLPPATLMGANTGGCLINGEPFVARGTTGTILSNPIPAITAGFYKDSAHWVQLRCVTARGVAYVSLFVRAQVGGTYALNRKVPSRSGRQPAFNCGRVYFSDTNEVYITDARHTGQLVLTYASKSAGLSAGTFAFSAVSDQDSTKTIWVASGRYDCKQ